MVAPNYVDNTFSVFIGRGDGTFRPPVTYAAGNNPLGIGVGDFNRDGKADVVITNNGEGYSTVSVFLGNGNGTFQPGVTYATGGAPSAVAVADLNADGILDLAVANEFDSTITYLKGASQSAEATDSDISVASQSPAQNLLSIVDNAISAISSRRSSIRSTPCCSCTKC